MVHLLVLAGPFQVLQRLLHQGQDAQAVGEAVVVSPWISQVADAQLVDAAQSLHLGAVKQFKKPLVPGQIDANVVVQRVSEYL